MLFCGQQDVDPSISLDSWTKVDDVIFDAQLGYMMWTSPGEGGLFHKLSYREDGQSITFFIDPSASNVWIYWTSEVWLEEI